MTRHVIILCQGEQTRLPMLTGRKQLLKLVPSLDLEGKTILQRTIEQVWILDSSARICVVGGDAIEMAVSKMKGLHNTWDQGAINVVSLATPGNSSLKGLAQILAIRARDKDRLEWMPPHSQTIVLLGDTVYSWNCLRRFLERHDPLVSGIPRLLDFDIESIPLYVTTSDMSASGGELWGVTWNFRADIAVQRALHEIIDTAHPPFPEYQPGQMRRLMKFAVGHHTFCDDYTRDIDIPEHLNLLPTLAQYAHQDDLKHGLEWT